MTNFKSIDPTTIESLITLGGVDFLKEVLEIFNQSTEKNLIDLNNSVEKQDAEAIFKNAHSLKSSTSSIGAFKMTEFCEMLEKMGRSNNLAETTLVFELLKQEHLVVKIELLQILQSN